MTKMYVPDNYDAFEEIEREAKIAHKNWLAKLPECSECGRKIKDDMCYEIGGDLICERCMENKYHVCTENYYTR